MNIPIALIIYNRPTQTRIVFQEIAKIKPEILFIIADGPRFTGEVTICEETRAITEIINWDCDVKRYYSDVNLGCKVRVSSGLDWVFEQCKNAIILEDDCLPHTSFFPFCEELLIRYQANDQVMMISGQSYWFDRRMPRESYFFSKHTLIWGWATWRRAWKHYDLHMNEWPKIRETDWLLNQIGDPNLEAQWVKIFDKTFSGQIDSWDYQWKFSLLFNQGLSIIPYTNLISNIGFGESATHTKNKNIGLANLPASPIMFPLNHPFDIKWDINADMYLSRQISKLSQKQQGFFNAYLKRIYQKIFR